MDLDMTNCILLHTHVDKKILLAIPTSGKLVYVQGMGVKKMLKNH